MNINTAEKCMWLCYQHCIC